MIVSYMKESPEATDFLSERTTNAFGELAITLRSIR
jgi:hypothetical protein